MTVLKPMAGILPPLDNDETMPKNIHSFFLCGEQKAEEEDGKVPITGFSALASMTTTFAVGSSPTQKRKVTRLPGLGSLGSPKPTGILGIYPRSTKQNS